MSVLLKPYSSIPCIPWLSLLRNVNALSRIPTQVKTKWFNKYGHIFRYPMKQRVVELYRVEDIAKLLTYENDRSVRPTIPIIDLAIQRGDMKPGISHVNGDEWYKLRSKMQKLFLPPQATHYFYQRQVKVSNMFIEKLAEEQSKRKYVSDIRSWACRYSAESIGNIILGANLNAFSEEANSAGKELCLLLDKLFRLTNQGLVMPPWSNMWKTKLYRDWLLIHDQTKMLIEEMVSCYGFKDIRSGEDATFFAQLLAKEDLSVEEAASFSEELFIAGVESTGNALTFLLYHLAKNPDVQHKLHETIVENTNSTGEVTLEMYKHMSYLKACMRESLRLTPAATGTVRITTRPIELSGYLIPADTTVTIEGHVVAGLDEYFSNPNTFNPDRWLNDGRQDVQPFSYIPFGYGARMCIGRRFAEQELMVAAMMMVKNFHISLRNPKLSIQSELKIFFTPDKQVDLILTRRIA